MALSILTSGSEEGCGIPTVSLTPPALVNNTTYKTVVISSFPASGICLENIRWYVNDEKGVNVAGGKFPVTNGSSVTNKGVTITWVDCTSNRCLLSAGDAIYIHTEELIETEYSFKLTHCWGSTRSPSLYMSYHYSIFGIFILSLGAVSFALAKVYKTEKRKPVILGLLILGVLFVMIGICALIYASTPIYSHSEILMVEVPWGT